LGYPFYSPVLGPIGFVFSVRSAIPSDLPEDGRLIATHIPTDFPDVPVAEEPELDEAPLDKAEFPVLHVVLCHVLRSISCHWCSATSIECRANTMGVVKNTNI